MHCDPHPFAVATQLSQGKIAPEQLNEEQIREVVTYLRKEEKWGVKQIAALFGIRYRPLAWVNKQLPGGTLSQGKHRGREKDQ